MAALAGQLILPGSTDAGTWVSHVVITADGVTEGLQVHSHTTVVVRFLREGSVS